MNVEGTKLKSNLKRHLQYNIIKIQYNKEKNYRKEIIKRQLR